MVRHALTIAVLASLSGCALSHGRGTRDDASASDASVAEPTSRLWVLVHPTSAPLGPGIYLFDEGTREILDMLPLPPGAESPHSLAWDGTSLWLGDIAAASIFELDPSDGSVRSRIGGIRAEGLVADRDGTIWMAGNVGGEIRLAQVTRAGAPLHSIALGLPAVQDLALANGAFYYLLNDDVDRIRRVDATTGVATDVVLGVHVAPYSLGFDGRYLAVAVDETIRRFDPETGALVSERRLAVPGWITAIAFVDG